MKPKEQVGQLTAIRIRSPQDEPHRQTFSSSGSKHKSQAGAVLRQKSKLQQADEARGNTYFDLSQDPPPPHTHTPSSPSSSSALPVSSRVFLSINLRGKDFHSSFLTCYLSLALWCILPLLFMSPLTMQSGISDSSGNLGGESVHRKTPPPPPPQRNKKIK